MSDVRSYLDYCAQDARLKRVSRMIPDKGPLDLKTAAPVLSTAREYLKNYGVSRAEVARALGTSDTYISLLFSESDHGQLFKSGSQLPPDTRDKLIRALNAWLEADFRARMAERPANYVHHAASKLIDQAFRMIHRARVIGIVDGPAGLGKSLTAQYVASELPGTLYICVDDDSQTAGGLRRKIHAACQLRRRARQTVTFQAIVDRLRGSGRLVIIDQAHDLRGDRVWKFLLYLHDQCDRLPIALLGTKDLHQRTRDDEDPEYGQLSSRIGYRLHLWPTLATVGDGGRRKRWISIPELRKAFASCKLHVSGDAWKILAEMANWETGLLRRMRNVLDLAETIATAAGDDEINVAHLEGALQLVDGEHRPVAMPQYDEEDAAYAATA